MEFSLSEEQQQLKDALRRYLDKNYTFEARRQRLKTDRKHWSAFADFGLLGIGVDEQFGGLGLTASASEDIMVVMECFGRAMVVEPFVSSGVMGSGILRDAGSAAQCAQLLPDMVTGTKTMALAAHERAGRYQVSHVATTARRVGERYLLNGRKSLTLHADTADTIIVSARTSGEVGDEAGSSLFLVDKSAAGLSTRSYPTFDGQGAAELDFCNVSVSGSALLGHEGAAFEVIERAVARGIAALCAEAVGAMDALIEQTREYIQNRKQFGVAIGSFQALQHRMVDMFIATEQARSITLLATLKLNAGDANERRRVTAAAKSLVGQSARFVGQQAVQLHGGMGVTDELPISHYFKRLTAIDLTFGDAHYHRARLAALPIA
jgi:alkylation response protein AidB-like acyl-CoA dehydrogenase